MSVRRLSSAIVAIALCATACGAEPASDADDAVAATTGEHALRAEYDQMWGELGRVHLVVTTTGPEQLRVMMTTPNDEPVSEWLWVYDGDRLLEHGNDPEGYRVYQDPEKAEFFEFVQMLVLPPGSRLLATACPQSERLGRRIIIGRTAIGYHCGSHQAPETFGESREIWVDQETGLTLVARHLKLVGATDEPVREDTFSTEPPEGAASDPSSSDPQEPSVNPSLARLRKLAATAPYPVYYLGQEFEGRPLVHVGVGNLAVGYQPELVAPAGTALRLVGQDEPTGADLPPPPPENVAVVDAACGATPGDHGPVGDQ